MRRQGCCVAEQMGAVVNVPAGKRLPLILGELVPVLCPQHQIWRSQGLVTSTSEPHPHARIGGERITDCSEFGATPKCSSLLPRTRGTVHKFTMGPVRVIGLDCGCLRWEGNHVVGMGVSVLLPKESRHDEMCELRPK